ncbi:hypothetical protein [Agromyces sp. Root1464]|uniref:hypothetical protein n=1 Tax=Agromyces sp. Root1464 TaxID=1736467 RepID=UPI0012F80146|nr:hypothetical protein [Agromyces sp. Root1464]
MKILTAASQPWWDLSLSNVLSAAQLVFTIAGFSIAIWQLVRSANANVASKALLEKVRLRLLGNDLLLGLPELHTLEDDLDEAVKSGEPNEIQRKLVGYSRAAARISGILKADESSASEPIVPLLNQAMSSATKAKAEIAEGTSRTMVEVTRVAIGKISKVSLEASSLIARLEKRVSD